MFDVIVIISTIVITVFVLLCIMWCGMRALALQETPPVVSLVLQQIGSETKMIDILIYKLTAAPSTAADAVTREVSVVVDGAAPVVTAFLPTETALGEYSVPQGAHVAISVVDIDDAGNRSEPAVVEFVAADTLPPPVPGGVGIELVREESIPDAPVVPEVSDETPPAAPEGDAGPVEPEADA